MINAAAVAVVMIVGAVVVRAVTIEVAAVAEDSVATKGEVDVEDDVTMIVARPARKWNHRRGLTCA